MNGCVVDSSVVVAALLNDGPTGRWAEALVLSHDLAGPELLLVEATNILRRVELRRASEAGALSEAFGKLMRLDVALHPFDPFAERIWELRSNLTSYDAWYVGLAEVLQLPLATLDLRLAGAHGPRCEFLLPPE